MLTIFKKYGVKCLWHFTDKSNLDSIINSGGLLSLREINKRNISPIFGGNQWSHEADERKGLDDYVHLTFIDDHPMLYVAKKEERIREPIWLSIDISVLSNSEVRYSIGVSNKLGVTHCQMRYILKTRCYLLKSTIAH